MNFLHRLLCVFLAVVLLAACGPSAPQPVATPIVAPTERAVANITMGQPWRYQHSSGVFAIDVPRGWSATDTSTNEELIVRFTEANTNAAMLTNVLTITRQLDSASLSDLLETHLLASYGTEPTFAQEPPATQQDGSQLIVWGYNAALADGTVTRLLGNSFIEQHGGHVSLLTVVVPSDQYPRLRPQIDTLLNSYAVRAGATDSASVDELRDVQIGALDTYTHTNDLFRIDAPADWTHDSVSAEGRVHIIWNDPSGNGWLIVEVLRDDSQRSADELAALLTDIIGEALGNQSGFVNAPPETQADGAAKLVWRYQAVADNGLQTPMVGSSFAMQRGEKIAILSASLPASQLPALQPQLDAIFGSFSLNETAISP